MSSVEAQWLVAVAAGAVMVLGFLAVYGCQQLWPRLRQRSAAATALTQRPLPVPAQLTRSGALDLTVERREGDRVH
jgi:hypothetical protein